MTVDLTKLIRILRIEGERSQINILAEKRENTVVMEVKFYWVDPSNPRTGFETTGSQGWIVPYTEFKAKWPETIKQLIAATALFNGREVMSVYDENQGHGKALLAAGLRVKDIDLEGKTDQEKFEIMQKSGLFNVYKSDPENQEEILKVNNIDKLLEKGTLTEMTPDDIKKIKTQEAIHIATKKQIPTKYRTRKTTPEQEKEINNIQAEMKKKDNTASYMAAKHEFFEKLEAENPPAGKEKNAAGDKEPKVAGEKKQRKSLTIDESKLGPTLVLSKGDCKKLGFKGSDLTTAAIKEVRKKLGLPEKPIKE